MRNKIIIFLSLATIILIILLYNTYNTKKYDSFDPTVPNSFQNSLERTQLYGSLFLDDLDKVIKNMTDPEIKYDKKRIELIKYSDILL
jgi:hypothetical protein